MAAVEQSHGACSVCCCRYTAQQRRPVPCPGCSYSACSFCVRRFLLSSQADPCCMSCGLYWTRAFIGAHLSTSWINGPLARHRGSVLLDRERSLLPSTQPLVELEVQRRRLVHARQASRGRMLEARKAYYEARVSYARLLFHQMQADAPAASEERRSFVAACPDPECRGFLSTQYRCGTCLARFCAQCRAPKPDGVEHACDPEVVATMALIAKECRACPCCGMAISRVSGCDHMWCTACETGFSYATGRRIHDHANTNPHMYERMRQLADEGARREAEGGAGGCAAGASWPSLVFCRDFPLLEARFLREMHQSGRHVERVVLPEMPLRRGDTSRLRVRFCLRDIDERRFSVLLQQEEKKREQRLETRAVLEIFVLLCFEFFARLARLSHQQLQNVYSEERARYLASVEELVNTPLQALADRYGTCMPRIQSVLSSSETMYDSCGHRPRRRTKAVPSSPA